MAMNTLHRKERLILTTIDIIEELGIQKLTTREIAKRQQVSEATIFRHYHNKNELLLAVLDYFTQHEDEIMDSIRLRELKPVEAIRFLVTSYAEYYENYPAITSILQLFDVLRYESELTARVLEIQETRTSRLAELIEVAQNAEEISKDTDSNRLAIIISGLIKEQCLNWRLKGYRFSLKEQIQLALEMILER